MVARPMGPVPSSLLVDAGSVHTSGGAAAGMASGVVGEGARARMAPASAHPDDEHQRLLSAL